MGAFLCECLLYNYPRAVPGCVCAGAAPSAESRAGIGRGNKGHIASGVEVIAAATAAAGDAGNAGWISGNGTASSER